MKVSSRQIVKSAEVYGAEATLYAKSSVEPKDFLRLTVGGEEGRIGERVVRKRQYGKGLYCVYNLDKINNLTGDRIYKIRVNLNGFISFDEDITEKIYGSRLKPSEQYIKAYGEDNLIVPRLRELEQNTSISVMAEPASRFLQAAVKGILCENDIAVIYYVRAITPVSYKDDYYEKDYKNNYYKKESEWHNFETEELEESTGRDVANSYVRDSFFLNEDFTEYLAKIPSDDVVDDKKIDYINFIIESVLFKSDLQKVINIFQTKTWAKVARQGLDGKSFMDIVVEAYIKRDAFGFLHRNHEKDWAKAARPELGGKSFMDIAVETLDESEKPSFMRIFSKEPWAQPYLKTVAVNYIRRDPTYFLKYYSEDTWTQEAIPGLEGKSYVDIAREALNAKGLNQTASQVNTKLLKLAEVLRSLKTNGLNKEISQIKDLARNCE